MTQTLEHWTEAEVRNMRRCIAYHQHRPLRTVTADDARAVMDEQQRRRNRLFTDAGRWYPSGWYLGRPGDPLYHPDHPCKAKADASS